MKIINCTQGTPEWHEARRGKMTASNAQAIATNGKGLETYIYDLMATKYSKGEPESFTNEHMERGKELEAVARSMYELQNSVTIQEVGFCELDEYSGASPDGLIGEDGGIEIKCHEDKKHFRLIVNGLEEVDAKYIWQIQMNLYVTGRKYWLYLAYNPNFEQDLVIFRIEPDLEAFAKIEAGLAKGKQLIKEIEQKYAK